MTQPRLLSIATASPAHPLPQAVVTRHAGELFGAPEKLKPVFQNAAIDERQVSAPVEWFLEPHSFGERNNLFLETADALLAEAAEKAIAQAGLAPEDIDAVVTVCSTGIATPALDARLMRRVALRRDVKRLPVFGLGCAGGVIGLARAGAMAKAEPGSRVLLLVVELCSLTFRHADRSKSNMVAAALFGDGAAAAVISTKGDGPAIAADGEHTWQDSLDVMGWDVADDGLKVVFSRDIPTLVRERLGPVVEAFLKRHELSLKDIEAFVCHPGGAKVIDALEALFGQELTHARGVLSDHGNMSAATVLFVLKRALGQGAKGRLLLTTLGPGFTAGMMIIEA